MIDVDIEPDWLLEAATRFKFKKLKGSMMKGKSNFWGALGEVVVLHYFEKTHKVIDPDPFSYDYDLIIDGLKVDVKTRKTDCRPPLGWNCNVFAYNTHQRCDFYFFVRTHTDFNTAYLLGWTRKKEFFDKAKFMPKGTQGEGFIHEADDYMLRISELNKFKGDE